MITYIFSLYFVYTLLSIFLVYMTIAIFATQNGIGKKFMPDKTLLSAPRFQTDDTVKNLYDLEKHVRSQKKA